MACVNESDSTPIKKPGCVVCGCEQTDSRKRTKLNGKVTDLQHRICKILNVPLTSVDVDGYICNERCYRDIKRVEKLQDDLKNLQGVLKEKFSKTFIAKRGVPTDSAVSPSVVPPSKFPRSTAQTTRTAVKSLSFEDTQFQQPISIAMARPPTSVQAPPTVQNELAVVEAHGEGNIGNICQVQV
jgi:hypothetical protein